MKRNSETGAIFLWLTVLLPLILLLGSYLYFSNSATLIRSQLQLASDAASLAGSRTLCSKRSCYNDAITAAATTLLNYTAHGGNGNNSLSVDMDDLIENDEDDDSYTEPAVWNYPERNLKVSILRGFWIEVNDTTKTVFDCAATSTDEFCFESMEGNWQEEHPGMPVRLIANSVKVEVQRTNVTGIFNLLSSVNSIVTGSSVALAGPLGEEVIAPFAIPVCALLDDDGDFNKEDVCKGDRLFTRSDRYLPEKADIASVSDYIDKYPWPGIPFYLPLTNPTKLTADGYKDINDSKLGVMPGFFYHPCSEDLPECGRFMQTNGSGGQFNVTGEYTTGVLSSRANKDLIETQPWIFNSYNNVADHYGVVGAPSNPTESNINTELGRWHDPKNINDKTSIGKSFTILHDGLTDESTGDTLWKRIINSDSKGSADDDNPLAKNTAIGEIDKNWDAIWLGPNLTTLWDFIYQLHIYFNYDEDDPYDYSLVTWKNAPSPAYVNDNKPDWYTSPTELPTYSEENSAYYKDPKNLRHRGLCGSRRVSLGCYPTGSDTFTPLEDVSNKEDCVSKSFNETISSSQPNAIPPNVIQNFLDLTGGVYELYTKLKNDSGTQYTDDTPVWKVKVPIIANTSASAKPCQGINGATAEPPITGNNYITVGFVDTHIYDLDIRDIYSNGAESLQAPFEQNRLKNYDSLPITATTEFGTYLDTYTSGETGSYEDLGVPTNNGGSRLSAPLIPSGLPDEFATGYDPLDPTSLYDAGATATATGPNPWNFEIDKNPVPCNLVRARIACNTDFIPSSSNSNIENRLATIVQ